MTTIKKRAFIVLFFIISAASFSQELIEYEQIAEDLYLTKISDSVFVIVHEFPWRCNSLFVLVGEDKGVLIDTPNETSGTKSLIDWIYSDFGEIEIIAINTGFHNDNLGGNEYLISKGIKVYGAGLTFKLIQERAPKLRTFLMESTQNREDKKYYEGYKNVIFLPPTDTFDITAGKRIAFGGEDFEVYYPGESHTVDNVVVYIKNKKVLFGGCMILSMLHRKPGYIEDAYMQAWPKSVEKVQIKYEEAQVVIPGHGDWGGSELITHTIGVLNLWNELNDSQ
jgi:glyoxylase-like metal-dependent hydrolase (beta-lactamase superfamily II)